MNDEHRSRDQDRRSFLKDVTWLGLGTAVLGGCARAGIGSTTGAATSNTGFVLPSADQAGLQLYTVRDLLATDFEGTLERVARIGYKRVEFAGYNGRTPAQVRATLDRLGLSAISTHLAPPLLRQDLAGQIAASKTIGIEYITAPVYVAPGATGMTQDGSLDVWKRAADEFNQWGAACKAQGMRFAYHNHFWEFKPLADGSTPLQVLLTNTDPALVDFENDLYWTTYAGHDPVQLFQQYPGRFALWHVKDMRDPTATKSMAPVGQGTIDFKRIFANASQAGLRYFFVEHDDAAKWPGGSLASIEQSLAGLRRLLA
jgi:sugar phosphate isomerase/epimerase